MRLKSVQSATLLEAAYHNGAFVPIKVGGGKSLCALLLPTALDSKRAVIFVPPANKIPFMRDMRELYNLVTLTRPGTVGTFSQFRRDFLSGHDKRTPRNTPRLRNLLKVVMIRDAEAQAYTPAQDSVFEALRERHRLAGTWLGTALAA